jgi:hypothetical protein
MFRILFATSFIALLACGSGESNQGNAINPGDTPPVSAAGTATDDIEIERIEVEAIEADPVAAEVTSCLDLVRTGAFEAALPMCLQAASIDPENAEVQAALAKSQAKVAMEDALAAAQAEAQAEVDGAAAEAAERTSDATDAASGAATDALGGAQD